MKQIKKTMDCPCRSGVSYDKCCGPHLSGVRSAATAESLMRSRFCAYRQGKVEYLLKTWHPSTRPDSIDPQSIVDWIDLVILDTDKGQEYDSDGVVEFRASGQSNLSTVHLHERSRFVKEDGDWFYVDGEQKLPPAGKRDKPGRNSPCACGSGKKFKRCCGR